MSTEDTVNLVVAALCIGSSVWVRYDAKAIGVQKGQVKGLADLGPWGWFFACLFLWIVAFPWYLAKRRELLRINGKDSAPKTPLTIGFGVYAVQIALIGILFTGNLKAGTDDLQSQVQSNISASFAKDPQFEGVTVQSLQLVHTSGNQYKGLLQVASQGQSAQLAVDVTYDGKRFMWQIER
jgi:hypothetical protein